MIQKKLLVLFFTLLLTCTIGVGDAWGKAIKILAIGNSFSEDAVEQNLHELAKAEGIETVVANLYIGGCPLDRHWKNAEQNIADYRYRKIGTDGVRHQTDHMTLERALADEEWDYVSLQQASPLSGRYESYNPYLPQLLAYLKKHVKKGVRFIWHQTWAYAKDSDHSGFANYNRNQMQMYEAIVNAANKAVKDNKLALLIPCGTAVQNARTSFIGDNMNRDGYHLNLTYGRFTAACTWFEALFKKTVTQNPYIPKELNADLAAVAKQAAHAAVLTPNKVTDLSSLKCNTLLYK